MKRVFWKLLPFVLGLLWVLTGCGSQRGGDLGRVERVIQSAERIEQETENNAQHFSGMGAQIQKVEAEVSAVRSDIESVRTDIEGEFNAIKASIKLNVGVKGEDISALKAELNTRLDKVELSFKSTLERIEGRIEGVGGVAGAWKADVSRLEQEVRAGRDAFNTTIQFNEKHVEALKNTSDAYVRALWIIFSAVVAIVNIAAGLVVWSMKGSRERALIRAEQERRERQELLGIIKAELKDKERR